MIPPAINSDIFRFLYRNNNGGYAMPLILILRPLERQRVSEPGSGMGFGIVGAELKRVVSIGRFMMVDGKVTAELRGMSSEGQQVDIKQEDLHELATVCEELRPDSLYARYASKKVFRHEEDFWATKEKTVRQYVKQMADRRIIKAVGLADKLDIPIIYAKDQKAPLHISDRLTLDDCNGVTPVMNFHRHKEGTTYHLQLRIGERLVERPSEHQLIVLTHNPGMFVLDKRIYALCDGFSGQLLLPFVSKQQVEIPRKMENDYFRRFILKQVARAEINAEGFDITDVSLQPQACLTAETSIDGGHILSLKFRYGSREYAADNKTNGRVTLTEEDDSFRFVRQLRDKDEEQRLTEVLRKATGRCGSGNEVTGAGTVIRFPTVSQQIDWLREYAPRLKAEGFDVVQPSDHIYYIGPLSVEQSDTWQGDWLQTDVTVVIDGGRLRIPFRDLRDTILRGEQEYMLPTGEILLIPNEWLKRYSDLILIGLPKGQGFQRHRSQVSLTPDPSPRGEGSIHSQGRNTAEEVITPLSPWRGAGGEVVTLRPYQQVGFQWLWQNLVAQTGCCLSDEMGLGKTLQTIALLLKYKEAAKVSEPVNEPLPGMLFSDEEMRGESKSNHSPLCWRGVGGEAPYRTSLVVAPASVVHNWRNELSRFAPSLSVMTYTGDTSKRKDKRIALMRWDVVLTTYRTLLNDIKLLSWDEFGIVVFDESQAFKTATSQIHHAVTRLHALHRMALSGTPVENNLQELWSLMNVLNPNLLGDERSFQNTFVNPIAVQMEESGEYLLSSRRDLLRRLIAPYFLKRTKEEVLSDLPARQDEVVVCAMTDEQTSQYTEELSKARNEWLDPTASSQGRQIHILAALQRLRQIANGEGKMTVVFDYLENLRQTQHKVLIFSEYVTLLEHVGSEMTGRGWNYALLTGQTQDREQVIARFQNSVDCQFFLISLKAGGVGLNLTAADYVFLLDPWWNRAAEEQAIARAHRIGQQRSVFVYRFVSAGTLEEQILTLQDRKQSLIDSVMPFIWR